MSCFPRMRALALTAFPTLLAASPSLLAQEAYRQPPAIVGRILDAPRVPILIASPNGNTLLLAEPIGQPTITDLSQPMLRLAGLRISPNTSGPHPAKAGAPAMYASLVLRDAATGAERKVTAPPGARIQLPRWSPDSRHLAFTTVTGQGIDLWMANPATGAARALTPRTLNGVTGDPCIWHPRSAELLCKFIPANRGPVPKEPAVPVGPIVQRNQGKPTPSPTYEDLLTSPYDESLFEYYATVQLARVDAVTARRTDLAAPGIYRGLAFAPGGEALLVSRVVRPFSYHVPLGSFAQEIEVWSPAGARLYSVAKLPAAEDVPIGGVPTGPREVAWKTGVPATLTFLRRPC